MKGPVIKPYNANSGNLFRSWAVASKNNRNTAVVWQKAVLSQPNFCHLQADVKPLPADYVATSAIRIQEFRPQFVNRKLPEFHRDCILQLLYLHLLQFLPMISGMFLNQFRLKIHHEFQQTVPMEFVQLAEAQMSFLIKSSPFIF